MERRQGPSAAVHKNQEVVEAASSLDDLRREWERLHRQDAPKNSRDLLVLGIAYRHQELQHGGLSKVRAAPSLDGNKIMRSNGQTPMIEGGFVLFPKWADWLDTYLSELLSFPRSNYDDQVDSTVYALAWIGENPIWSGNLIKRSWIHYYAALPEDQKYKRVFMSWDTALQDGG